MEGFDDSSKATSARKPFLDVTFERRAPPRPSSKSLEPRRWNISLGSGTTQAEESIRRSKINSTTRRQIFLPTSKSNHAEAALSPISKTLGKNGNKGFDVRSEQFLVDAENTHNNIFVAAAPTITSDGPSPFKRRKGTPQKVLGSRQQRIKQDLSRSLKFGEEDGTVEDEIDDCDNTSERTLSPAAKSLFGPMAESALQRKSDSAQLITKHQQSIEKDPWEAARKMSPEQQRHRYWEILYGSKTSKDNISRNTTTGSLSAQRVPPSKGCFSNTRDGKYRVLQVSPSFEEEFSCQPYNTPKSSPRYRSSENEKDLSFLRSVQFGPTQAAVYEPAEPASALKPMSPAEAAVRYPTEERPPTEAEVSFIEETKENTAMLDGWDEDEHGSEYETFTLGRQSDDSSEEDSTPLEPSTHPPPSRPNRKRRSSSFFAPSAGNNSLLDDSEEEDEETISEKSDFSLDAEGQLTPPPRSDSVCATTLVDIPGLSLESPAGMSNADDSTASFMARTQDESFDTVSCDSHGPLVDYLEKNPQTKADDFRSMWKRTYWSPLDRQRDLVSAANQSNLLWPMIASGTWLMAQKTNKEGQNLSRSVEEIEELAQRAVRRSEMVQTEREKIQQLQRSALPQTVQKHLNIRMQASLEASIRQLEQQAESEHARVLTLRRNDKIRTEFVQIERDAMLLQGLRDLAPLCIAFLPRNMMQVTLVAEALGISLYAPAQTICILSNELTGRATHIFLVDVALPASNDGDKRTGIQIKCKSELENELFAMRSLEMDCSEAITRLLIVLSGLRRLYQTLITAPASSSPLPEKS